MKELADGTKVSARTWYYLLDWNEADNKEFMVNIGCESLYDLNKKQYQALFSHATRSDLSRF